MSSRSTAIEAHAVRHWSLMLREFAIGFATTFKHIFKKPITVNYPDQKVPMFPKYRGKQVLMRDENGLEKCVACGLCSVACPADAIYLEAAENDGTRPGGPALRVGLPDPQDALHLLRLLRGSLSRSSAIFMGKDYELAVYSKDDFVWDKQDLLVPAAVTPAQRRPPGSSRLGDPSAPAPCLPLPAQSVRDLRRRRRHPRRLRRGARRDGAARRRAVLGLRRRRREQRRARTPSRRRRSTGSRATTRTST